jgi:hypothetical protein
MRHQRVAWLHEYATEPVVLYAEIDDVGWERRKVDEFRDGRLAWADRTHEDGNSGTALSIEPMPSLDEINLDPEFDGAAIPATEFEAVWARAVASPSTRDIRRR